MVFAGLMDAAGGADAPGTWHYGVVAQWWSEFNTGGPEIACFRAALYRQAMHELDLPRAYRTVYVCGGFGIGGDRDHDQAALRRFRDHLRPGGALVMDAHLPYKDGRTWQYWLAGNRRALPEQPPPARPRAAADGSELDLSARVVDLTCPHGSSTSIRSPRSSPARCAPAGGVTGSWKPTSATP